MTPCDRERMIALGRAHAEVVDAHRLTPTARRGERAMLAALDRKLALIRATLGYVR